MNKQEITTTVLSILRNQFIPGYPFDEHTSLIKSKIMDSIAVLNFVNTLEETFKIEFAAHEVDADNLDTVLIIADFISRKK